LLFGWCHTRDKPPDSSKLAGATHRQVPQSMQVESTKIGPAAFSERRFARLAIRER
jgi:hypothetical protein